MTNPKWPIGIAALFVAFTILANIIEGVYGVGVSRLEIFFNPFSVAPWTYIDNVWGMLWFSYPALFHGPWLIVKYAVFWPISIGLIVSLFFLIATALGSAFSRIFGFIR